MCPPNTNVATISTLPAQSSLAKLLCGVEFDIDGNNNHHNILKHLSDSINQIVHEIKNLSSSNISFYGPFLGRSILELGATALIARLDPLRILILEAKQKQPSFEIGKPNKSSIRWRGDVLPEDKTTDLWSDKALQNPTRSLLGEYYTELVWMKSVDVLFDQLADIEGNEWIDKIKTWEPKRLNNTVRISIENAYSSLSKGIHHEFVIPPAAAFDPATIEVLINESIFNMATLGLLLTVVSHTEKRITDVEAIEAYKNIQIEELVHA